MNRERALRTIRLQPTDRIPHWESLSNPDFTQLMTGIDPWEHPRQASLRLHELLPLDVGGIPARDDPIPRVAEDQVTFEEPDGSKRARWGMGRSWRWNWGRGFNTVEDVLAYEPLEHLDLRKADIVANHDYSLDVTTLAAQFQHNLDAAREATGDLSLVTLGFYNTLFMWPLLTFGWELFCETAMWHPAEMRWLLRDFAELSRKVFQAFALTDVELITSHDDICYAGGPAFSPAWLRENIYPYYEEFWSYVRETGKKVVFVSDGDVTLVADDLFTCGADGIRSEPYTDWRAIAAKNPDKIITGDGDNRIIATEDREAIWAMVREMAELGRPLPGYFMSVGNQLPWNLSPMGIKIYFEAAEELGRR